MEGATTVEISAKSMPRDLSKRAMSRADLLGQLSAIRRIDICSDTFWRWRKLARVTNRSWYSGYDYARLVLVAHHLFSGGRLDDVTLQIQIQELIDDENQRNPRNV